MKCTSALSRAKARGKPRAANLKSLRASASQSSKSCPSTNFPVASAGAMTALICSRPFIFTARRMIFAASLIARTRFEIGVILDVVYNHFGPDGNYLRQFSEDYFTDDHVTEWGDAINFYGENSAPVREFVIANAGYWIDEFHLDGLRLDATQNIYDESADHILAALTRRARCGGRQSHDHRCRRKRAATHHTCATAGAGRVRNRRAVER